MKTILTILAIIVTVVLVSFILFYAVVGVACLHMTTPIVTQEPTHDDIRNYIRTHNPQFTVDESEMR